MTTKALVTWWSDDTPDADVFRAVGRPSDFSGFREGRRDHGWVVQSDDEAIRVGRIISSMGLPVDVREQGQY